MFAQHLAFLSKNNFRVVSILDLKKDLLAGKPLAQKTVVITFDDGFRSIYTHAVPLLKKYAFPFTVFINTKPHDEKNPQYLSWKELEEMQQAGAVIANHSDGHPHFIRNSKNLKVDAWQQSRWQEIAFAEKRIEQMLGVSHKLFAYPYGEYDPELVQQLSKHAYMAFTQQSGPVAHDGSHQLIPRFPMGASYGNMREFTTKLNSLPFPALKIQALGEQGQILRRPELGPGDARPKLQLNSPVLRFIKEVNCYASGQGLIETKVLSTTVLAQAGRALPVGRSRYNCTAHAGGGRYYWYSHLFIRRLPDGSWYRE